MRMRKLRGPNKKMSMPFEKFRTRTQPVNLSDLAAMGADRVNTVRTTGEGTGYSFGQAYKAGGAWPNTSRASASTALFTVSSRSKRLWSPATTFIAAPPN